MFAIAYEALHPGLLCFLVPSLNEAVSAFTCTYIMASLRELGFQQLSRARRRCGIRIE